MFVPFILFVFLTTRAESSEDKLLKVITDLVDSYKKVESISYQVDVHIRTEFNSGRIDERDRANERVIIGLVKVAYLLPFPRLSLIVYHQTYRRNVSWVLAT